MNTISESTSQALARVFGYDKFRPHQEDVVDGLLGGEDVFALMPTGGGKSLCYQLPSVMAEGCVVVVSPLIALMKDQVDGARANGIRAACVNSSQSYEARRAAARAYRGGELDLLYLAPERLAGEGFFEKLRQCPTGQPAAFAIDEAHCLSEWGHDFRPDYLALARIRTAFPEVPIGAFTATATERVGEDIVARLGLRDPIRVRASFDRGNLFYEVRSRSDLEGQLVEFLRERRSESGIIYCTTRKAVEGTVAQLQLNGIDARGYHAGMENHEREAAQEAFIRDNCQVIVATVAFGMGIDKADVRFVVHADLPKNLESYYQETGRAGRDGEPAHCLLLYSAGDVVKHRHFSEQVQDAEERSRVLGQLVLMDRFAAIPSCRRRGLLAYFGEHHPGTCGGCDVCNGNYVEIEATSEARIALGTVAETGQRFGAVHLCDVLVGAATAKVRERGHDELRSFGVGGNKSKTYWRKLLGALLAQGLLVHGDDGYPVPNLTTQAEALMRGEGRFVVLEDPDEEVATGAVRSRSATVAEEPYNPDLLERLVKLRKEIADREEVPPYVVFSNRTLRAMAGQMPESTREFATLHGVGAAKLEKYGAAFLSLIREFVEQHPSASDERVEAEVSETKRTISGTVSITYRLLEEGVAPSEISRQRGLSIGTIFTHIAKLIEAGEELGWREWVSQEDEKLLRRLFGELGTVALNPVIEAADGMVNYEQAKVVRALMGRESRTGGGERACGD